MSSSATLDFLDARQVTQLTVGVLLLNCAMCFSLRGGHTFSMTSHRSRSPVILRLELVMMLNGFSCVWKDGFIFASH